MLNVTAMGWDQLIQRIEILEAVVEAATKVHEIWLMEAEHTAEMEDEMERLHKLLKAANAL